MKTVYKLLLNLKNPTLATHEEQCAYVIAKYMFAFIATLSLMSCSYALADLINTEFPFNHRNLTIFQISSVSFMAIGVLGEPGRKIHTWGEESKAEEMNEKISKGLTCVGFLLSFCSYHLVPAL